MKHNNSSSTPRINTSKKVKDLLTGSLTPCQEEEDQNYKQVSKNLTTAFDQTQKVDKSQSLLNLESNNGLHKSSSYNNLSANKHLQKDMNTEQLNECIKRIQQEKLSLINKQDLLKTKLQFKSEALKQYDYQIKDIMVKLMDLSQKANLQCDQISSIQLQDSVQNVINDRIKFIRKHLICRIDTIKQKNKLISLNQQVQFLTLELNFQKQNKAPELLLQPEQQQNQIPLFNSLMTGNMHNQLQQIITYIKLKQQKLQSKLNDLDNKTKLQSQLSKQQLMDQSVYDYYSTIEASQQIKQNLKQQEYELQKSLKKFNKQEKLIEQKQGLLEQIINHDQIQLIRDYRQVQQQISEKCSSLVSLQEKIKVLIESEQVEKIAQLTKKLKNLELEKKKLAQRLIIRRNECLFSKQEKEEIEKLNFQIDAVLSQYSDICQEDQSQKIKKNKAKQQLSPTNLQDSIVSQMIERQINMLKIIESLQSKDKLNQFRASQNLNDLETYLQSTSILSPTANALGFITCQDQQYQLPTLPNNIPTNENLTRNITNNNSLFLRTFDQQNPMMTTNTMNQYNSLQQEVDYFKSQYNAIKQQLVESENERDQLSIEFINKKESYETVLRNIREQITEKEFKYSQLFKDMQFNIQELQRKNNDMVKVNSDLIKKVCTPEKEDCFIIQQISDPVLAESLSKSKRLEWFVQMQSSMIEDIVKQKSALELKCQTYNLKNQHYIERLTTNGTIDTRKQSQTTLDNRNLTTESFVDKQFQSSDLRQIQQIYQENNQGKISRDMMIGQTNLATELTQNTENNQIKQLFEVFQKNYLQNNDGKSSYLEQTQQPQYQQQNQQEFFNHPQIIGNYQQQNLTQQQSSRLFNQRDIPLQRKCQTKKQSINTTKDSMNIPIKQKLNSQQQSRPQSQYDAHKLISPHFIQTADNFSQNVNQFNQSSQLIDNTNLLINNNDISSQQLPLYLCDDGQQDSDLIIQPNSVIDTAQQSTLNCDAVLGLDQQLYSFNNSNLQGAVESGSNSGTNAHNALSNNLLNSSRGSFNNVWTAGLNSRVSLNQQQNLNLELLETQSQQSLVQTFGKQQQKPQKIKSQLGRQQSIGSINKGSNQVALQKQSNQIGTSQQLSEKNLQQYESIQSKQSLKNSANQQVRNISSIIRTNKR